MKRLALLVFASLCLCAHDLSARPAAGSRGSLCLLFDRGLDGKDPARQQQLNQVSDFFERDMVRLFQKAGFDVSKITARDQFKPGPDNHLLMVATVQYLPGNKAARMVVGFGAGGLISLTVEYQLFGEAAGPLLASKANKGSVRDWQYVCRALAVDLVRITSDALPASK